MNAASLGLSVVALLVAVAAALYARRQAVAAEHGQAPVLKVAYEGGSGVDSGSEVELVLSCEAAPIDLTSVVLQLPDNHTGISDLLRATGHQGSRSLDLGALRAGDRICFSAIVLGERTSPPPLRAVVRGPRRRRWTVSVPVSLPGFPPFVY